MKMSSSATCVYVSVQMATSGPFSALMEVSFEASLKPGRGGAPLTLMPCLYYPATEKPESVGAFFITVYTDAPLDTDYLDEVSSSGDGVSSNWQLRLLPDNDSA